MNKTFIIAELGINMNGDVELAKKMILAAKSSGADSVKFQKRTVNKVYSQEELDKPRESPWGKTNREQKYGIELSLDDYDEINIICKDLHLPWFVSAWDLQSVDDMSRYNLSLWKIPSALLTHLELCKKVASLGKKTFISTGMSTIEEITICVDIFKKASCPYSLMHCNSQYPLPEDERVNLKCINTLREHFCCDVGYSSHESGIINAVAAVVMGATSIEKHITMDRSMYGSDQSASVEPSGFYRMVDYIRTVEKCMGDGIKRVTIEEEKIKLKLRRYSDVE